MTAQNCLTSSKDKWGANDILDGKENEKVRESYHIFHI